MPIHTYRCACGRSADVLVRGERVLRTCDDAPNEFGFCAAPQALTRQLTAPYVGRAVPGAASRERETCGHCGSVPGSCDS
ncbi:MAG: hypothetical protein RLZZ299_2774 [Pseudomonadota bacterium]|jgi:hypothetical protein